MPASNPLSELTDAEEIHWTFQIRVRYRATVGKSGEVAQDLFRRLLNGFRNRLYQVMRQRSVDD